MLSEKMSLDSYEIELSDIQADDIPSLYELSLSVRWPHRAQDWSDLIHMGEGLVARDLLGRLICSMMWFPMDERFASVGMGISTPRLQELGAGRWMAEHIKEKIDSKDVFLIATKDSLRLCLSFGFEIVGSVFQFNGVAKSLPEKSDNTSPMQVSDFPTIKELDEASMGFKRDRIIEHLISVSEGTVIRKNGKVKGFALCRPFGRGHVVGPIVAECDEDAIALIQPFLEKYENQFLRVDIYQDDGVFRNYLLEVGLNHHETATKMVRGNQPTPLGKATTFGLASQALG